MGDANRNYVNVLQSIYYRFMRLKFSHRFVCSIAFRPEIKERCINLCDCLCWTFATDAYVTIDGLFSNGTYSFVSIDNAEIRSKVNAVKEQINQLIPNFHKVRNKMFAHLVEKSDGSAVCLMFEKFEELFCLITELHEQCLGILDINLDFKGYSNDVFVEINKEFDYFSNLCFAGFSQIRTDELHEMLADVCNQGGDL